MTVGVMDMTVDQLVAGFLEDNDVDNVVTVSRIPGGQHAIVIGRRSVVFTGNESPCSVQEWKLREGGTLTVYVRERNSARIRDYRPAPRP